MTENNKNDIKIQKAKSADSTVSANPKTTDKETKDKTQVKKKNNKMWVKDLILATINIMFIVGLIFLLNKLPLKAEKVKAFKSTSQLLSQKDSTELQKFDLENNKDSIQKITNLFANEDRLLAFVDEIEKLKVQGTVVGFTFASSDPVIDKTRNLGLPIIIEFSGSWEQINNDLKTIQNLPFLFRPVTFDAEEVPEESVVLLKYGGFLYVDESFEKN